MIEPFIVGCDYPGCGRRDRVTWNSFGPYNSEWLAEYETDPLAGRHLCCVHREVGFAELDRRTGKPDGPVMRCLKCEKEMKMLREGDVSGENTVQPDDGGTLEVYFTYGSRHDLGPPPGPHPEPETPDLTRADRLKRRYRHQGTTREHLRYRLYAFLCDDCFDRYAEFVFGYSCDARGYQHRRDL